MVARHSSKFIESNCHHRCAHWQVDVIRWWRSHECPVIQLREALNYHVKRQLFAAYFLNVACLFIICTCPPHKTIDNVKFNAFSLKTIQRFPNTTVLCNFQSPQLNNENDTEQKKKRRSKKNLSTLPYYVYNSFHNAVTRRYDELKNTVTERTCNVDTAIWIVQGKSPERSPFYDSEN